MYYFFAGAAAAAGAAAPSTAAAPGTASASLAALVTLTEATFLLGISDITKLSSLISATLIEVAILRFVTSI